MKSVKRKLVMPLLVMAFAIAGAFATNAMGEKPTTQVTGYIDAPQPCKIEVQCDDQGSILCTDENDQQAFGKASIGATTCAVELYRLMP